MPTRLGILALALVAVLSACGSDSKPAASPTHPSTRLTTAADPGTPSPTVPCAKFKLTAARIVSAQSDLYRGKGSADADAALQTLVDELKALKPGAPTDVQAALDDMAEAFQNAEEVIKNPSSENRTKLADLGQKLSEDGQKITAYVVASCK